MNCEHCCQNAKSVFDNATCVFSCQRNLTIFLLNVLLNLKNNCDQYCYCELSQECTVCQFKKIYSNDEYEIYGNCFDLTFLAIFHVNLYHCLEELFETKKHIVCHLIFSTFKYAHYDWFTGKKYVVFLEEAVAFYEKKQIDKIKNNGCQLVIDPLKIQDVSK